MKNEIYSCLKMFESFSKNCIKILNSGQTMSARNLYYQYKDLRDLLLKSLDQYQIEFIPKVEYNCTIDKTDQIKLIQTVISASEITISYLRSLEMNLDKEMEIKKKELELKEKEVEHMNNLLSKSLKAIEKFPELQRSKVMEDIKKSHREIEKNTNPDTKSQNN